MNYAEILIPLDGSEIAEAAVRAVAPIAKAFGSRVALVGVVDLGAGMYDVYSEAFTPLDLQGQLEQHLEAALRRAAQALEGEGIPTQVLVRTGIPHEEIGAAAAERGTDLIVMTTHGRRGLTHLLLGSVAEKVIRTAPCPVLVVRPEPGEKG